MAVCAPYPLWSPKLPSGRCCDASQVKPLSIDARNAGVISSPRTWLGRSAMPASAAGAIDAGARTIAAQITQACMMRRERNVWCKRLINDDSDQFAKRFGLDIIVAQEHASASSDLRVLAPLGASARLARTLCKRAIIIIDQALILLDDHLAGAFPDRLAFALGECSPLRQLLSDILTIAGRARR